MKLKATELPRIAKDLYVKLYCKENNDFSQEMVETALQSWYSLGRVKKEMFRRKMAYLRAHINGEKLKCTVPFLNKKPKASSDVGNTSMKNTDKNIDNSIMELLDFENEALPERVTHAGISNDPCDHQSGSPITDEQLQVSTADNVDQRNSSDEKSEREQQEQKSTDNVFGVDVSQKNMPQEITDIIANTLNEIQSTTEPIPPAAKTGRELFYLLNKDNNIKFEDLPSTGRRAYFNALSVIKKKYIQDYKKYLESMTNEQLHDYYVKTMQNVFKY